MKQYFLSYTLPKLVFAPVPFNYGIQSARNLPHKSLYDLPYLQHITKKAFYFDSSFGYRIRGQIFFTHKKSKHYIILLHGYYGNQVESLNLVPLFLKCDFNVIIVDGRHHGKNNKTFVSFGIFERQDMKLLVDLLIPKLEHDAILGLFGHSLGAAVALQTAAIDSRIQFIIASAPYNRLDETLASHFLYRKQTWLSTNDWQTFFSGANHLYNINFQKLDVASSVQHIQCPVLYLHGLDDRQNPTYMSAELHSLTPHSVFFTFPNTTHNTIFLRNYDDVQLIIDVFLNYAIQFQLDK
ncbi:MAG: alpha/beta hydrolase [Culicoidibacterales bacterium]